MRYHNITKDDMLQGEGLRVALWLAGCEHFCKGCQNPQTWDPNGGIEFDEAAKQEIFEQLEQDYIHGLTLTGGDPLHCSNLWDVTALAKEVKERFPNKTIWLYTGSEWVSIYAYEIMKYVDVVVDGEFVEELHDDNLWWKGSSNQRVINVQETLSKSSTPWEPILFCHNYTDVYGESIKYNVEVMSNKMCSCCG